MAAIIGVSYPHVHAERQHAMQLCQLSANASNKNRRAGYQVVHAAVKIQS